VILRTEELYPYPKRGRSQIPGNSCVWDIPMKCFTEVVCKRSPRGASGPRWARPPKPTAAAAPHHDMSSTSTGAPTLARTEKVPSAGEWPPTPLCSLHPRPPPLQSVPPRSGRPSGRGRQHWGTESRPLDHFLPGLEAAEVRWTPHGHERSRAAPRTQTATRPVFHWISGLTGFQVSLRRRAAWTARGNSKSSYSQ